MRFVYVLMGQFIYLHVCLSKWGQINVLFCYVLSRFAYNYLVYISECFYIIGNALTFLLSLYLQMIIFTLQTT